MQELRAARKEVARAQRQQRKQTRAVRERKVMLVGEAVLRRVDRDEFDAADFRVMMAEYEPTRPTCNI
ncbi:hypothetical protein [Burkholderia ambifaria]|uniref:hypothetical protein n=1 Tax=Burkholderia ambifaria TaxID=152480 RepID=UPI00158F55A8|nr:hypothetical protein [Burkholderia ambifaria]